jgi:thioredoxin 1
MAVIEINDSELLINIARAPFAVLKYHTDEGGESCINFVSIFTELSKEPKYQGVTFLRINADNHPIAKKYILSNQTPVITIYRSGRLIKTAQTSSKKEIQSILDSLLEIL